MEIKPLRTDLTIGLLYTINGCQSPNARQYIGCEKKYCQLHGEFIGYQYKFRKKRNSALRPWGAIELYGDDVGACAIDA